MTKLQKAIHGAAVGLMLAGSIGVACAAGFAQTQTKPPATKTPATSTKTTGSVSSHSSTTGSSSHHSSTTSSKINSKKKAGSSRSSRVKMQTAPTADRIRDIQSALAKSGTYNSEPTGTWDAQTIAAMQRFQQSNGLTPSGKLDALTLQKLGLGSDTTGKGAPRLVPAPAATAASTTGNRR